MRKSACLTAVGVLVLAGCTAAPPELPPVPPMSNAEVSSAYELFRESRWSNVETQHPTAVRPAVDRIRYITPGEMPEVIAECLRQAGFDASTSSDPFSPALQINSPEGQEQGVAVAWYVCDSQYPVDPSLTQPFSTAEIEYMYDYNVRTLLPCLAKEGFPLEAPSKQDYVDSFETGSGWYAYSKLPQLSGVQLLRVQKLCPQNPPGFRDTVTQ